MKALVTGATGFLGKRLVADLLRHGYEVRCLTRPSSDVTALKALTRTESSGTLEIHPGKLTDPTSCKAAVAGCDVVFHLAAQLRGATPLLFMSNVVATRQLIASAASVRRFVLVSSLAVYDTNRLRARTLLTEECSVEPAAHRRDGYTYSKIVQEEVAWEGHARKQIALVVVRPGVLYGPGRDCISGRLGLQVGKCLIRMGGKRRLPYTYVDNCAESIRLAGTTPNVDGQAFNIVDDDLPTSRDLLRRYEAEARPLRGVTVPGWAITPLSAFCEWSNRWSKGHIPAVLTRYRSKAMWQPLNYSNVKAKTLLGWRPAVDFNDGLRRTFAWVRERGCP